jgi:hypothetical protein
MIKINTKNFLKIFKFKFAIFNFITIYTLNDNYSLLKEIYKYYINIIIFFNYTNTIRANNAYSKIKK